TAKKDIDSNKPELNDLIMHWVLAKYRNTNWREDESLIDIIDEAIKADKDVQECSKREDQEVGKTNVSKVAATDVIEVDQDTAKKDIDSNKPELNDIIMHWVLAKYRNTNWREDESLIDIIDDYDNSFPSYDELDSNSPSSDEFNSTSSSVEEIVFSKGSSNGLLKWHEDEIDEEEEVFWFKKPKDKGKVLSQQLTFGVPEQEREHVIKEERKLGV
nr:hypothetical protein [Tanacetum cinerariifolium]